MTNTYEDFITEIKMLLGIDLAQYKERQMKRRIIALMEKNGYKDFVEYFFALKFNKDLQEQFLRHITINVSEFFRNYNQWEILETEIIPYLLRNSNKLKVWSAACSAGEEPYTLVMILSNFLPMSSIEILATDIDDEVLQKAQIGLYTEKSLQEVPQKYKDNYFIKQGEFYKIKNEVKNCVKFMKHDLLKDSYPRDNDLIVCRNVMIYFTEAAKEKMYVKFNHALKKGGVLFVGSTEQIIMCNKYKFNPIRTFFYKKEDDLPNVLY